MLSCRHMGYITSLPMLLDQQLRFDFNLNHFSGCQRKTVPIIKSSSLPALLNTVKHLFKDLFLVWIRNI